jgi:hypothetical protein
VYTEEFKTKRRSEMKKTLTFLAVVGLLSTAAVADVNVKDNINYQNLSKRPYSQAPVESKKDNFEGATLINEQVEEDTKHKPMRLHMLGRQPYAVKNSD